MDPIRPIDPRERDLERIYRVERLRDERRREQQQERQRKRREPQPGDTSPDDEDGHTIDVRV